MQALLADATPRILKKQAENIAVNQGFIERMYTYIGKSPRRDHNLKIV